MNRFRKKLRAFWRRRQLDGDLDDELRFHLEMKAEETGNLAEARRRMGNATALREVCREIWTFPKFESWWQDVRYALRLLLKTPGFTLVAAVALGLGIGADTAVFTIATGAFSWDLGLEHIDRTVVINLTNAPHRQEFGISYPDFRDFQSQTKSLAGLAVYQFVSVNLSDTRGLPDRYYCVNMSASGFSVSEQRPAIGRVFTTDDERPGAPAVVVLTNRVWQDRYASDPAILGKTIHVNDVPAIVVGVMPPGKRFPEETDLWAPLIPGVQEQQRANRNLMAFGRLADGVRVAYARTELAAIAGRLAREYPDTNKDLTAEVQPIGVITGAYNMRPLFVALWVAVGFVVLIACADVANMLLARGAGRMREISIRIAIGAGRRRIVRQLLIESVILSAAGGLFGWLVAMGGLRWFDLGTGGVVKPVWLHLSLDGTAFTYLAIVSIGTGILFGLAPALQFARVDVHRALKDGGQGVTSRRVLSVSNLLVVLEMALCVVLLAGAGLMIRSTVNLYGAPIGADTAGVLTMRLNLPEVKYPQPGDQRIFHRALQTRLESLPGVESAAFVSNLPLGGWMPVSYELEGSTVEPDRAPEIGAIAASPSYFGVMRVRPLRGRSFTGEDGVSGTPVAMVNQAFAARFWPGENAIGKRLRLLRQGAAQPWLTVVGVLPDVLQNFRRPLDHDPLIYLPETELPQREMFIASRTRIPPAALADSFRRAVQSMNENLPVYDVRTMEDRLAEKRLSVSLLGGMFSVFAGVALLLAALGLYAVIAHSINERTQEIGLRMAIGGTSRDILRLVYVQGMRPLAIGLVLGLPAALAVTHVLRMALIGVSPGDPATYLGAVTVLVASGALGCAVPARRAIRIDPIVALRYE